LHEKLAKEISTMPRTPKQEDFLATARKSQEIMVDAIRTWVETVRTATPRLSSVYAPFAERLAKVPAVHVPLAGKLPTPKDAVASAYDLAERLLASQRKFAEEVLEATKPLMPGYGAGKPQDHSETAPHDHSETARHDHTDAAPHDHTDGTPHDHTDRTPQDQRERTTQDRETAPEKTATESVPQETPAPKAPRATSAKTTAAKTTAAKRTPKSTATSRTPKSMAARRAPGSSDAG
jgi:hypothetical protein